MNQHESFANNVLSLENVNDSHIIDNDSGCMYVPCYVS